MPKYSQWTSIAFDVARSKGAKFSGSPPSAASDIISVAADVWSEDPDRYRRMTKQQAREVLSDEIQVSQR